jgi:hypothetical protein
MSELKFIEYTKDDFIGFGPREVQSAVEKFWQKAQDQDHWIKYVMRPTDLRENSNQHDWDSYEGQHALMQVADVAVIRYSDGSEKVVKNRFGLAD